MRTPRIGLVQAQAALAYHKDMVSKLEKVITLLQEVSNTYSHSLTRKPSILRAIRPSGSTMAEILKSLVAQYPTMTKERLSPRLTSFKQDGLIEKTDGRWFLTKKGYEFLENGMNNDKNVI